MAYMVPEVIRTSAAAGERLLFRALKECLPSDYMVYYEPEIEGKKLDFVVIGPDLGLVVLEVRDYTASMLFQMDDRGWQLHTAAGRVETVRNPYNEARDHARHVANQLSQDPDLIQTEGKHRGQLKFACGCGTVFTRLKRDDFIRYDLYEVIAPEFVLCRDEIDQEDARFSADGLIDKIHGMFTAWSSNRYYLTAEDIRAIRQHLFAEARISAEFRQPADDQDQLLLSLRHIQTTDLHQENRARAEAGGGKPVVLAGRARRLAKQYPDWKILVLCREIARGRTLRQTIEELMKEPEDLLDLIRLEEQKAGAAAESNIAVFNFHEWLRTVLNGREADIPVLIEKLDQHEAILPTYDAIFVDEGKSFEPEWLQLLGLVLNPETQRLPQAGNRAQGMGRRDRSRILSMNYRNTAQIVQFAWDFYQRHSALQDKVQNGSVDGVDLIPPYSTHRKGPEPVIARCDRFSDELKKVVERIAYLHDEQKIPYADMAILYRVKDNYHTSYVDAIRRALSEACMPYDWILENEDAAGRSDRANESIKLSTIIGAKALAFRAVFVVNVDSMPYPLEQAEEKEVSLFYSAMTRALDWLFVSYSGESKFTAYLDEVLEQRSKKGKTAKKMG
ncbi:UvrD-like helicase C-terminal domain-containing protein [Cohnella sp. OV330]|uniref:nuclease-related domain-containing DEAD/DEAH box helicase n=1 Tax=Cohnella sp. OV330 TaxID=1855288 RepID=UPI0008E6F9DC|nr:3'-5' exonuclease [Cohnella sp. OV330]SFA75129.1 UvrD-like helicase C-terminal domain-containing protein [Cohnella sp. OV330]